MQQTQLTSYHVWGRGIRWFHWINVLSVLALLGTGLVIFNGKTIGLAGDAKILMKELHVWAGYLFATNLAWRIVQGFRGSHFARWRTLLPFGNGFLGELRAYLDSLRSGEPRAYLGHNPLGKLMVISLFLLLITQAITGLLIAGTDLYYPPLGGWIAEWVAPAGVDPASLVPGDRCSGVVGDAGPAQAFHYHACMGFLQLAGGGGAACGGCGSCRGPRA